MSFESSRKRRKNWYFTDKSAVYKAFGIKKTLQNFFHKVSFSIVPGQAHFDFLGQRNLSFQSSRKRRKNGYFTDKSAVHKAFGIKKDLADVTPQGQFFY